MLSTTIGAAMICAMGPFATTSQTRPTAQPPIARHDMTRSVTSEIAVRTSYLLQDLTTANELLAREERGRLDTSLRVCRVVTPYLNKLPVRNVLAETLKKYKPKASPSDDDSGGHGHHDDDDDHGRDDDDDDRHDKRRGPIKVKK